MNLFCFHFGFKLTHKNKAQCNFKEKENLISPHEYLHYSKCSETKMSKVWLYTDRKRVNIEKIKIKCMKSWAVLDFCWKWIKIRLSGSWPVKILLLYSVYKILWCPKIRNFGIFAYVFLGLFSFCLLHCLISSFYASFQLGNSTKKGHIDISDYSTINLHYSKLKNIFYIFSSETTFGGKNHLWDDDELKEAPWDDAVFVNYYKKKCLKNY